MMIKFSLSMFYLIFCAATVAFIAAFSTANTCRSPKGVCSGVNTDNNMDTTANEAHHMHDFAYKTENGNICLENIKNMRDISSAFTLIQDGRLYRTDCVSNASSTDVDFFETKLGIKTLIDVRSADELEKDDQFHDGLVYNGFVSYQYDKKRKSFEAIKTKNGKESAALEEETKRRYLISFITEKDVIKIVFFKLSLLAQIQTILLMPFSFIKPIKRFMRRPFIDYVNKGGLSYLNEMILKVAGEEIGAVLRLFASTEHAPMAFYCTAGKDRTGLLSMLLLYLLDVPMEHIVADYEVSAQVYAQLDDQNAVVASLERMDMDPKIFLGAPAATVYDTFQHIEQQYGSVEAYLATYGFMDDMKLQLKRNFLSA